MTRPRHVVPERFYVITRRCTQRTFLLRPDDEVNNAFVYCLAVAAEKAAIDVLMTCAMSDHHHTVIYDRDGRYPEFLEHFHKLLARCLNFHWNRRENFWSSDAASVVRLASRADVLDMIAYVVVNPVAAGQVARASEWPGVNGYAALLSSEPMHAHRPKFFRPHGPMPASVELPLKAVALLGDDALASIRDRVERAEADAAELRAAQRRTVAGAEAVLAREPTDQARSEEELGTLNPTIAAKNVEARVEAIREYQDFYAAYTNARHALERGEPIPFPAGTWLLKRRLKLPTAS